jgi:hypothetical protein
MKKIIVVITLVNYHLPCSHLWNQLAPLDEFFENLLHFVPLSIQYGFLQYASDKFGIDHRGLHTAAYYLLILASAFSKIKTTVTMYI